MGSDVTSSRLTTRAQRSNKLGYLTPLKRCLIVEAISTCLVENGDNKKENEIVVQKFRVLDSVFRRYQLFFLSHANV